MADKSIRIKADDTSSTVIETAVRYGALGSLIPGIGTVAGVSLGMVGGVVAGAVHGKINADQSQGIKTVRAPTIFNTPMLVGAVAATGTGLLVGLGGLIAAPFTLGIGFIPAILGLGAAVGVPVIAGLFGKAHMQKEYDDAKAIASQQSAQDQLTLARARGANNIVPFSRKAAPSYTNTVPLAEIEAAKNAPPVVGGFVARQMEQRQQQQLAASNSMPT